ncbi:MAG: hypothetical protein K2W96_14915 [Gemmataceae bacterium]|nr:hypothetical protein [Gemmataceae bacterium]
MRVLSKLILYALSSSGLPVEDFLGPHPNNPAQYIPWERKAGALLDVAEGRAKDYEAILKLIREKRESASSKVKTELDCVIEYEKLVEDEKKRPKPDQERIRIWTDNIRICRICYSAYRKLHEGRITEEACFVGLGKAFMRVHADNKKKRPAP